MNPITDYKGKGLLPLPEDARDFAHDIVFGSIAVNDLPTHDFLVSVPLEIKNQDINYPSDFCTSYGAAECAEDEDQVIFVPEWTFAQAKQILSRSKGNNVISQYGLNLRDICKAATDELCGGFLPRLHDPFKCDTADRPARDFLADWKNWSANLYSLAAKYRKASYFAVTGPHDLFDNIRSVMWQNLEERRSVLVGCLWRLSWNTAKDAIVPEQYENEGSGHAFKICGQKTIEGELYLVAQLSDGVSMGDNGYFYFPRSVVNEEFAPFGSFTFTHLPPDSAAWHVTHGVPIYASPLIKFIRFLANLIHI